MRGAELPRALAPAAPMRVANTRSGRRLLATAAAALAENAPACRKKTLVVDGNNALYHFYDPLCSVEQYVLGLSTVVQHALLVLLRLTLLPALDAQGWSEDWRGGRSAAPAAADGQDARARAHFRRV